MDADQSALMASAGNIEQINSERAKYKIAKLDLISKLDALKNRVRTALAYGGRLPPVEYAQICHKQALYRGELNKVELALTKLRADLDAANARRSCLQTVVDHNYDSPALSGLRELRQKYADFASDSTRVASMRTMAAAFAEEIGDILRAHDSRLNQPT